MEDLKQFIEWAKEFYHSQTKGRLGQVMKDTDEVLENYQKHLNYLEKKLLSVPVITMDRLGGIPTGCDTLAVGITHQVRYNGIDFHLNFLVGDSMLVEVDFDEYHGEIYNRIHEQVTTDEMCELPMKYVRSLFDEEVLEKFNFKEQRFENFYDLDIHGGDIFECYEGRDS